ncbi:SiaB family protein kinase [Simplicispira lacusdiani]|uniref:SiaB family protein kinase n=1 Tax=Simplicispira lacusdiani TaxID=2213010 RepID=UPI000E72EF1E|nr:SiaB family protein kinase [Simplicispira lacusdiani]
MTPPEFARFQENAQDCGVLFYYTGEFSPPVIAAAADSLKTRLAAEGASGPATRKLFSTFVEMAHNILHYAAPADDGSAATPHGTIAIGREDGQDSAGHYWIVCSNPVDLVYVERLSSKLDAVRAMSLEQIKQSYREQLRNSEHRSTDAVSKGAGLGLLTIARDASAPLEYSFSPATDPSGRTTLFHVKARV